MSPPEGEPGVFPSAVDTFMASPSIFQFLGISVPLHCLHPSKFLPLNSKTQPAFFSCAESWFIFCATAETVVNKTTANDNADKMFLFILYNFNKQDVIFIRLL